MNIRRALVPLAWVLACALFLPRARHLESVLRVAARVDDSESALVDDQLARRFASPFAHSVVLVVTGAPSPLVDSGRDVLRMLIDSLQATRGVSRALSYLDGHEPLFLGTGGYFVVVGLDTHDKPDVVLDDLRQSTARLTASLRRSYPAVALRFTGETALNVDLRRKSAEDARRAEWRALPVTLGLLLVAFGALAAALLPIGGALLAIGLTLGATALIGQVWSLSILLQNVVTMIGLGLGIDYSLLVLQRFRDELRIDNDPRRAARAALRHAGPTILLSGTAVAIGFGALAVIPVNELRSVAIGGLLVTAVSMLVATTLLPVVLATLGSRVDAGRVTGHPEERSDLPCHPEERSDEGSAFGIGARDDGGWRWWARLVTKYPRRVLLAAGLPVCLLASQALRLRTEQPRVNWLPPALESAIALHDLEHMGRGAIVQTLRLTLEFPRDVSALSDDGWTVTSRLARDLVADSDVARVRSLPGLVAPLLGTLPRDVLIADLPDAVRHSFVSRDDHVSMLEVIPREGMAPAELAALVRRVRLMTPENSRLLVGGLPALNIDYEEAVAGRRQFTRVVTLIVIATLLVLAIGFRSLLVPVKAIVLNLLAVSAAFGAVTLVFQDGIGASLLGLGGALGSVFPAVPVLVFCVVFGLSMDYEVFLVARVREARLTGRSEREAIAEGLTHTARLITSAAAIMIIVFGAFMLGDFLLMKMLGFALAFAVLIDATVMRLAVSPALLALAGKWNWWPGERRSPSANSPVIPSEATPPVVPSEPTPPVIPSEATELSCHPERSDPSCHPERSEGSAFRPIRDCAARFNTNHQRFQGRRSSAEVSRMTADVWSNSSQKIVNALCGAAVCTALLLVGCLTPDEVRRSYVDRPDGILINPDSIRVGQIDTAYAIACPPTFSVCIGRVRDLTWRVHPDNVAIVGVHPELWVVVRGVKVGGAWIVGAGPAGADSAWLRVLP
jgi:RND superfamily putative drug exporter